MTIETRYITAQRVYTDALQFPSYQRAATALGNMKRNFIVSPEVAPTHMKCLFLQISSSLYENGRSFNKHYLDHLYTNLPDYVRPYDFMEIPLWVAYAEFSMPGSDLMIVRDVESAAAILPWLHYKCLLMSALDINRHDVASLARAFNGPVYIGGYTNTAYFSDIENVKCVPDIQTASFAAVGYHRHGVSYRHFIGTPSIPRLVMSHGCLHHCDFCTVERGVTPVPFAEIDQQVEEIAKLNPRLIYVDDKTFGQCENCRNLTYIGSILASRRTGGSCDRFDGFIIQTTAPDFLRLSDEFLSSPYRSYSSGYIRYVELGVESFNDHILRGVHKPTTTALIQQAVDLMKYYGIWFVPNILVGMEGETEETYANTLSFLERNKHVISHVNIYSLSLYNGTEIAKRHAVLDDDDSNENVLNKSRRSDKEREMDSLFAERVIDFAIERIGTR